MFPKIRKRRIAWFAACLAAAFSTVAVVQSAFAATGCRVDYAITAQWSGGFQGSITLVNLGDRVENWTLNFMFPDANQKVDQGWNADWTQAGTAVTVRNAGWNGTVAAGASVTAGFTGRFSGANPVPASFSLNGTTCTGAATASPSASASASASASPIASASASPSASASVSASASPSASASADPWNPPSTLVAPLAAVWQHQEDTYSDLYGFKNYGWDQLFANNGTINYCVRWDSSKQVSTAQRDAVHAALQKQYQKWMDQLTGWNAWPYQQVKVNVVGWAVRDRAQLEWTDSSVDIYVNDIREDAPQCSEPCGRFFHQDGNYSGCTGGTAHHYDHSLWLTDGFNGGAGGDWGQRIGTEYFMSNLTTENVHVLLHEIGHTYGLDDFYDWDPLAGKQGFIMMAGSATEITEFDKWMLRDWWRHLKSRYGL
ncbi:cellulose binding domain-containing protein [Actinoplanes sp. CA-015351]|uniref:cellulose-binding domain-containing protein n=1 Tax=Actinoplanes sp. CA-015351 TaxID=3239897 RepID=UPI003D955084